MQRSDDAEAEAEDGKGAAIDGLVSKGLLDKDSPLFKAAVCIQSRYRGYVVRKVG